MTSKERILNTVYRKKTDRVPVSLYELSPFSGSAYASFANEEPSYQRLLKIMRDKTDTLMMSDPVISYPEIEAVTEIRTWREGEHLFEEKTIHTPKGDLTSKTRRDDNIFTVWVLEHLLKEPDDIEKYRSLNFSSRVDTSRMMADKERIGDAGILLPSFADPICHGAELFSMEDFLVFAIRETERAEEFLDWIWEMVESNLARILKADVRDVMVRIVGPEYATPPYLGNSYYDRFVTKYVSRMAAMIKAAGAIPRVHSHGRVRYALSRLAETEVMCVDPVEPLPDGDISLREVKTLYGDKFTILGNIELKMLETASPRQVEEAVRSVMEDAKEGGGLILMPTATPINLPLSPKTEENLIAMIEAGLTYGRY